MGPTGLFDKSFLQCITVDESVWFDHFFISPITPLFYAETLADLDKKPSKYRKTATSELQMVSMKFPQRSGAPCHHHLNICICELWGNEVPMNGQIPVAHGKRVQTSHGSATYFAESDESKAFKRWNRGEYHELEHAFAKNWRASLPPWSSDRAKMGLKQLGIGDYECNSFEKCRQIASDIVQGRHISTEPFQFVFQFLGPGNPHQARIIEFWKGRGCPALASHAPYTSHLLQVWFFFVVGVANKLISDRITNQLDIAYLYYLPFCNFFVSRDKLHQDVARFFTRDDQDFVDGNNLKSALSLIDSHFKTLPDAVKEQGIFSFAARPPTEFECEVTRIWDKHMDGWRKPRKIAPKSEEIDFVSMVKEIRAKAESNGVPECEVEGSQLPGITVVTNRIQRKRGSWYQVPKDMKIDE